MSIYCRNCGNEMDEGAAICTKCGFAKGKGTNFCAHCGKPTSEGQSVCMECGFSLGSQSRTSSITGKTFDGELKRSRDGKLLGGVCAGLEKYKGINKTITRLIFLFLLSWNFGIIVYILLCFVMPMED